jgi:hypothetical protein
MRKKHFRLTGCIFVLGLATVLLLVLLSPLPAPPKSIDFTLRFISSTNSSQQSCSAVISNTLNTAVICDFGAGFRAPALLAAYLSNSVWHSPLVRRPGGGAGVIQPHQSLTSVVELPRGATTVKVGLFVTPLSWRGRLGWSILASRRGGVTATLGRLLLSADTRAATRSRVEWSDPYSVRPASDRP